MVVLSRALLEIITRSNAVGDIVWWLVCCGPVSMKSERGLSRMEFWVQSEGIGSEYTRFFHLCHLQSQEDLKAQSSRCIYIA